MSAPTSFPPLMFSGTNRQRDPMELVGDQVTKFLKELRERVERETRLKCATVAVTVAQEWAANNSATCHPEAANICEDLGEEIRKTIMGGAE